HEPAPDLGGRAQRRQLVGRGAPYPPQHRRPADGGRDQARHQQYEPEQDARANRVERPPHHCSAWATSRPSRTTPITTDFAGTSPLVSNAIVDVPAKSVDRKSTRLNSGHVAISYAVFCLKKKK